MGIRREAAADGGEVVMKPGEEVIADALDVSGERKEVRDAYWHLHDNHSLALAFELIRLIRLNEISGYLEEIQLTMIRREANEED